MCWLKSKQNLGWVVWGINYTTHLYMDYDKDPYSPISII